MPRSKKRVAKSAAPTSKIKFDKVFTSWVEEYVLRSTNPDIGLLAAAAAIWVGVGDPDKRGVNQCVFACGTVQSVLAEFGYNSRIVPVQVITRKRGESDRRLGSADPAMEGLNWSGHCVLWVPGMSILFDPTIGQARMATSKQLRYPVVMHHLAFATLPAVGSSLKVQRQDVGFNYHLLTDNGSLGHAMDLQRTSVKETVARNVNDEFRYYVADLQRTARRNAAA